MRLLVKAIYKQGIFEPVVPIEDLAENEEVQLKISPIITNGFIEEEDETWEDVFFKDDQEWEKDEYLGAARNSATKFKPRRNRCASQVDYE